MLQISFLKTFRLDAFSSVNEFTQATLTNLSHLPNRHSLLTNSLCFCKFLPPETVHWQAPQLPAQSTRKEGEQFQIQVLVVADSSNFAADRAFFLR